VDGPTHFGFMYTTTAFHIEEAQERFVLTLIPRANRCLILLEAVSRPRHILARIGYPFLTSDAASIREEIRTARIRRGVRGDL